MTPEQVELITKDWEATLAAFQEKHAVNMVFRAEHSQSNYRIIGYFLKHLFDMVFRADYSNLLLWLLSRQPVTGLQPPDVIIGFAPKEQ